MAERSGGRRMSKTKLHGRTAHAARTRRRAQCGPAHQWHVHRDADATGVKGSEKDRARLVLPPPLLSGTLARSLQNPLLCTAVMISSLENRSFVSSGNRRIAPCLQTLPSSPNDHRFMRKSVLRAQASRFSKQFGRKVGTERKNLAEK